MKRMLYLGMMLGMAVCGFAQFNSESNDLIIATPTTAAATNYININRLLVTSDLSVASGTWFTASSIVFDGAIKVDASSSTGSCVFECTGAPVLLTPENGIATNSPSQVFQWEAINGATDYTFRLYSGTSPVSTSATGGATTSSVTFPPTGGDGIYFWTVDWSSGLYTSVESPKRKIIRDTTPPTTPLVSVDSTLTGGTFTISWTATDALSGIVGYEYSTDGGTTWNTVPGGAVTGITLTLPPGSYNVMVRAFDAAGNLSNASNPITVTVSAPIILYANPRGLVPGATTNIQIVGKAFDLSTAANAVSFTPFSFTPTASSFTFAGAGSTLINASVGPSSPSGQVGAMNVSVQNVNGSSTSAPSICAYSDAFGGSLSISLRTGDTLSAYQMISAPVFDNPVNFFAAIQNALGPYNIAMYRLWRYNSITASYEEFDPVSIGIETTQILDLAGYSFWLISRNGGSIPVSSGRSTKDSVFVYVPIRPGWNQIANPYSGNVVWGEVKVGQNLNTAQTVSSLAPPPSTTPIYQNAFFWAESGSYVQVTPSDVMLPTLGYWVFNGTNDIQVLYFPKPLVVNGKPSVDIKYSSPSSGTLTPPLPPGATGGANLAAVGGGGGGGCFVQKPATTGSNGFNSEILPGILLIIGILFATKYATARRTNQ